MLPKLPPGFENRSQYERTLATPLGKEWNTHSSHKKLIQPRVNVKAGAVIHPLRFTGKDKTKTL
jgi:U3 small nucleolar RNA-associated protein 14